MIGRCFRHMIFAMSLSALGACATAVPCERRSPLEAAPVAGVTALKACRAGRGDPAAQYALARAYRADGQFDEAVAWYRRAAAPKPGRQRYVYSPPVGAEEFGRVLPVGRRNGTPGFGPAQLALGDMYLHGLGVERDLGKARKWFSLAVSQGMPGAAARVRSLPAPDANPIETGSDQ